MSGKLKQLSKSFSELAETAGKLTTGEGPKGWIDAISLSVDELNEKIQRGTAIRDFFEWLSLGGPLNAGAGLQQALNRSFERLDWKTALVAPAAMTGQQMADAIMQPVAEGLMRVGQMEAEALKRIADEKEAAGKKAKDDAKGRQKAIDGVVEKSREYIDLLNTGTEPMKKQPEYVMTQAQLYDKISRTSLESVLKAIPEQPRRRRDRAGRRGNRDGLSPWRGDPLGRRAFCWTIYLVVTNAI